jgi:signal transduction histidine kinase/putative methionine-R-sulfoxide reductase with GAF domain
MTMPGAQPERSPTSAGARDVARVAETAHALVSTHDVAALIEVVGEACRAHLDGRAWRFLALDSESGALSERADGDGRAVLPEPGGALEWLLRHETALTAVRGRAGDPACEDALWAEPPKAVCGWPLRSGGVLHGLLLVALDRAPDPGRNAIVPRLLADQLALALERHALRVACARQRESAEQLEVRANSGEQLFSELISVVAHEIRTPLTSIKAYTESLIDAPAGEFEQRRTFLGVIDEECDRLARLVSDALDLSRLEAGHRALRVRAIDPRAFVADLAETVAPEIARQGLALSWDVADGLGPVEGDPDLLKQLVLNLTGNAIKFSPQGGPITITARADDADWQLDIRDAGVGIPEDQLDLIFERFYRVELKGGRRVPGTGLGLAIARHIVELHGGRIWAANAAGGGSVFSLRLPQRQLAPENVRTVVGALADRVDVRALLTAAVDMVGDVMEAEIVSLLLVDPRAGDLVVAAARGLDQSALDRRHPYRGGVAGAAVRAGVPLLVDNIETDRRFSKKSHPQYFTKSLLCAPLLVAGEAVGVINVNNKASREEFDAADLALVTTLVARLSAALNRAHAYPNAAGVVAEATAAVLSTARTRRELLLGRSEIGRYAFAMSARLGLPESERGLVARLAEDGGAEASLDGGAASARAILTARAERMDGTGFPHGLAGEAIPLGARILAALDAYIALTHGRPYRAGLTATEALAVLGEESGRGFDPRVLAALADVLGDDHRLSGQREVA